MGCCALWGPLQFHISLNMETKFHKSRLKGAMQMRIDCRTMPGWLKVRCMHQGTRACCSEHLLPGVLEHDEPGVKHKDRNAQPVCQAWLSSIKSGTVWKFFSFSMFLLLLRICAGQPVPFLLPIHPPNAKGQKSAYGTQCTLQLSSIQLSGKLNLQIQINLTINTAHQIWWIHLKRFIRIANCNYHASRHQFL